MSFMPRIASNGGPRRQLWAPKCAEWRQSLSGERGGRLSWQRKTCEKSQLARLPLMISLPISLKRKKKRSRCHYGSGRNPRLVRPRRYKAEQMSRSVKNEEKRRLTAAPLSCLFSSSDNVYRKCLANGTWALKGNYSMCKAILHEEVRPSYECMSWLTRRFHTEPSKHETYINQKKKKILQQKARLAVESSRWLRDYL